MIGKGIGRIERGSMSMGSKVKGKGADVVRGRKDIANYGFGGNDSVPSHMIGVKIDESINGQVVNLPKGV